MFLICMTLAMQGSKSLQVRGAKGVPIHRESLLRLDNIGKKCSVAFYLYSLAPPKLIASIQNVKAIGD